MTATILVADDDAAIRTVLNQALSRAGYEVRITSNAATLWRWIAAGQACPGGGTAPIMRQHLWRKRWGRRWCFFPDIGRIRH